jgi:hypothetical protein
MVELAVSEYSVDKYTLFVVLKRLEVAGNSVRKELEGRRTFSS